jgi:N-acetylmuramoyl-L-alanine amidase
MKTVYLDPGHGGADPGALGPSGLRESDMALDVCLRIKKLLDPYVNCFLTRSDDRFLTLSQRPAIANKGEADAFLSYHFNAAESPNTASSWEIFTTRGQNRSDKLASAIGVEHAKQFPDQRKRQDWSDGDLDKEAGFAVIRGTDHPACLMEGEFIHTVHGEALIKNPKNRQKMAVAAATGILNFLGVTPTTCKC